MYIEPCCIDKQLPALIKSQKFCFFQTNGDCTLSKVLNAVSSMVGNDGHVMVLTVGEVDVMMLRTLEQYLRRGWSKAVLLLTARNQETLVRSELGGYLRQVHYAVDPMVVDGQIVLLGVNSEKSLIIQGAVLGQADFSLSLYTAWLGSDLNVVGGALDPIAVKLKTKAVIDHHEQPDVARILNREW